MESGHHKVLAVICFLGGLIVLFLGSCSADRLTTYCEDRVSVVVKNARGHEQEMKVLWFGSMDVPSVVVIQFGPVGTPDPPISERGKLAMKVGGKSVFRPDNRCIVIAQLPDGERQFSVSPEKAANFFQSLCNVENAEFRKVVMTFVESETSGSQ